MNHPFGLPFPNTYRVMVALRGLAADLTNLQKRIKRRRNEQPHV